MPRNTNVGDSRSNRRRASHGHRDSGRRSSSKARSQTILDVLNDRAPAWRTVRSDSRLRVLLSLVVLDRAIGRFVLPNDDAERNAWVEFVLYITKPRSLELPRDKFHVTLSANRRSIHTAVAGISVTSTHDSDDAPDCLLFYDVVSLPMMDTVPDPSTETFPQTEIVRLNVDNLAERTCPPKNPHDCVQLAIGAWWHLPQNQIYYMRMEASLLSICPEGWTTRSLGATLCKLLDHRDGCSTCDRTGIHVDAYNCLWVPNSLSESCACLGPCLWRKAVQCDVPVRGNRGLCQALFVAPVSSVRVIDRGDSPCITGRLDELIAAGGGGRRVPVNNTGWHLVKLPTPWSAFMVSGCSRLSRSLENVFGNPRCR